MYAAPSSDLPHRTSQWWMLQSKLQFCRTHLKVSFLVAPTASHYCVPLSFSFFVCVALLEKCLWQPLHFLSIKTLPISLQVCHNCFEMGLRRCGKCMVHWWSYPDETATGNFLALKVKMKASCSYDCVIGNRNCLNVPVTLDVLLMGTAQQGRFLLNCPKLQ